MTKNSCGGTAGSTGQDGTTGIPGATGTPGKGGAPGRLAQLASSATPYWHSWHRQAGTPGTPGIVEAAGNGVAWVAVGTTEGARGLAAPRGRISVSPLCQPLCAGAPAKVAAQTGIPGGLGGTGSG